MTKIIPAKGYESGQTGNSQSVEITLEVMLRSNRSNTQEYFMILVIIKEPAEGHTSGDLGKAMNHV